MIAYLDSSVILRVVLGERGRLAGWHTVTVGITSALAEVECLRTLDRLRLRHDLAPETIADRRAAVFRLLEAMEVVEIAAPVLSRASQPFPTLLGSLDAIHLATALLRRERMQQDLVMATHDIALSVAARSLGFTVLGS